MEKSVVAILIPKQLSKDEADVFLEGMRTEDVRSYETYKSYIQVAKEHYDEKEVEVITIDKEKQVFGLVAPMEKKDDADGTSEAEEDPDDNNTKGEGEGVEKDTKEIDYATMDSLYDQLYAMADIVGGALRQEGQKPKERTKVILSAIDNFRNFAEVLMNNANSKSVVSQEAIDRHPLSFKKEETEHLEKQEETKTEFQTLVDTSADATLAKAEEIVKTSLETLTQELEELKKTVDEKIQESATSAEAITDDLAAAIKAVKEDVDALKKSPKTAKSERDEETTDGDDQKDTGAFKGAIFATK